MGGSAMRSNWDGRRDDMRMALADELMNTLRGNRAEMLSDRNRATFEGLVRHAEYFERRGKRIEAAKIYGRIVDHCVAIDEDFAVIFAMSLRSAKNFEKAGDNINAAFLYAAAAFHADNLDLGNELYEKADKNALIAETNGRVVEAAEYYLSVRSLKDFEGL